MALGLAACVSGAAPASPSALRQAEAGSVEYALSRHPERMTSLLAAMDLTRPELALVRERIEAADAVGALRALVDYYRTAPGPTWIAADPRGHAPQTWTQSELLSLSEQALSDVFTFQGVTGPAPRLASGGLDWTHRGPRDDLEWALFFNRHFHLLPMLWVYGETRDRRLAARINATVIDWVLARPPEEHEDERALSASWRPMSSASRLLQVWPQVFFALRNDPEFTDEALLLMLSSVPEQADHVRRHHRERHNHTIKEMAGLVHAGAAWPEFSRAKSWRDYGVETLTGELQRQFYPDGVHQELSAHYHRSALEYFVWTKDFMTSAGYSLPEEYRTRIERAAAYLAYSLSPTGFGPLNNNGDLDANRPRVTDLAERFDNAQWRFIASQGAQGVAPAVSSVFFPFAGQAFFRSGWGSDAHFSLFDIGPWGAAHQHNDKLNLVVSAFGRDLLVDGGRYRYTSDDPYVAHLRSTAGHNTLLIDGRGQGHDVRIVEAPLARAFATSPALDAARGVYDAGYPGLEGAARHERTVVYVRNGYWIVLDRIVSDRPRTVTAHWRFHPDVTVRARGATAFSDDPETGNLHITLVADEALAVSVVRGREAPDPLGWYSPAYNERAAASVAVFHGPIAPEAVLVWVLAPSRGVATAPQVQRLSAERGIVRVRIARPGAPADTVSVRLEPNGQDTDVVLERTGAPATALIYGD